ncbi:MAG: hypothetical protein OXQ89_21260 [Rhodospirillaceae bacterium]|nr:hypothetical protein [Rhodospirillaceae bacterium]MDE0360962.1 hypothetical protein [Rhodospirillaceae bacterium]
MTTSSTPLTESAGSGSTERSVPPGSGVAEKIPQHPGRRIGLGIDLKGLSIDG